MSIADAVDLPGNSTVQGRIGIAGCMESGFLVAGEDALCKMHQVSVLAKKDEARPGRRLRVVNNFLPFWAREALTIWACGAIVVLPFVIAAFPYAILRGNVSSFFPHRSCERVWITAVTRP